jgi:hypothetical protein
LENILREYEVDINEPTEREGRCLLHLVIGDEDVEALQLILSLPKKGFKT